MVNSICMDGIRSGASDIHIEANTTSARIPVSNRWRPPDGQDLRPHRFPAVSFRIKIMANLNILERRLPQDGRITVSVGNENVDLRVSIVPVAGASPLSFVSSEKCRAPDHRGSRVFPRQPASSENSSAFRTVSYWLPAPPEAERPRPSTHFFPRSYPIPSR